MAVVADIFQLSLLVNRRVSLFHYVLAQHQPAAGMAQ
jgi:hypothetical protein